VTIAEFEITANDTLTPLCAQLKQKDADGDLAVVDLTGMTVKFKMIKDDASGTVVISETASGVTIVSAEDGKVRFDFSAAQVATSGLYWGWFVVYSSSKAATFPQGRGLLILIHEDE